MAAKLLTEKRVKKLNEIKEVDIDFVSLVRHGANRQAFRVVKRDGGTPGREGIQTLVVPVGTDLSELAKTEGMEWISDLSHDSAATRGDFVEYQQHPKDLFDEASLKIKNLDGAYVTVGTLKATAKADVVELPTNIPPAQAVVSTENIQIHKTFGDVFFEEIDNFISVAMGLMRQKGIKPKARRNGVMEAHKAFGKVLNGALSVVEENEPKGTEKSYEGFLDTKKEEFKDLLEKNENPEGRGIEMFESKEEFAAFIRETMASENQATEEREKLEAQKKEEFDAAVKDAVAKEVEALKLQTGEPAQKSEGDTGEGEGEEKIPTREEYEALKSELAELKHSTEGSKSNKSEGDEASLSEPKKKSVFHGALFDWKRIEKTLAEA